MSINKVHDFCCFSLVFPAHLRILLLVINSINPDEDLVRSPAHAKFLCSKRNLTLPETRSNLHVNFISDDRSSSNPENKFINF